MKYFLIVLAILTITFLFAFSIGEKQEEKVPVRNIETLTLNGSNTIGEDFAPLLAESFLRSIGAILIKKQQQESDVEKTVQGVLIESNTLIKIEIMAHGSSTGFLALAEGNTQIAMSSRKIKADEHQLITDKFGQVNEHPIALDALAIITYPENPVDQLTIEQVAKIFSGEIKNWQELGGDNKSISLFSRDNNSGTWDTFNNLVLQAYEKELSESSIRFESSGQLVSQVVSNKGSLGFVGVAYIGQAKLLKVSRYTNDLAEKPGPFTIGTLNYPLSRKLYLYAKNENSDPMVQDFINFVNQDEAQKLAELSDLVSYYPTKYNPDVLDKDLPKRYKELAMIGNRITVDFSSAEHNEDSAKEERDILRLENYIKQNKNRKIVLVNFSKSKRVETLQQSLRDKRLEVMDILNLSHLALQERNIEVWIL